MKFDLRSDGVHGLKAPIDDDATFFHAKLLDSISDGVYFVDVERKISYWNRDEAAVGEAERQVCAKEGRISGQESSYSEADERSGQKALVRTDEG